MALAFTDGDLIFKARQRDCPSFGRVYFTFCCGLTHRLGGMFKPVLGVRSDFVLSYFLVRLGSGGLLRFGELPLIGWLAFYLKVCLRPCLTSWLGRSQPRSWRP